MSHGIATVDLNSDLGESFGRYRLGLDDQVIPLVSSVNIACGMHAGDPLVMDQTVCKAIEAGVALGAHPGYPDLQGFGRRDLNLSANEIYAYVLYQIGALGAFAQAHGALLHHVKPHGQLYNRAAVDPVCAQAIVRAVYAFDPALVLVGLANSELVRAAEAQGLRAAQEFFADRAYGDDGLLVPRSQPGALIEDEDLAVARAVRAVTEGVVETVTGSLMAIRADTLCVHGDGPRAVEFAARLRTALEESAIAIRPVGMLEETPAP